MIPPFFFRSLIFNVLFYLVTAISCFVLLPTLLLPRKYFLGVVHYFVHTTAFLEKYILGLTFEVRGLEHLPIVGPYLVASKHQSAYETTKLHILFDDPAIVLKKELLRIPLWGWYLAKSDVIAIDRSTPKSAILSIQDGAKRMASQGRPIVIFPQGTRVTIETPVEKRPYKIGIIRMQEATGLPIIPLAMNTGVFWPRNSILKKPGHVIFEFLPPIVAGGKDTEVLARIQKDVEEKSKALATEGLASIPKPNRFINIITWSLLALCLLWSVYWFIAAKITANAALNFITEVTNNPDFKDSVLVMPKISGFPFKITLQSRTQKIMYQGQVFEIASLQAQSWPFLGAPITVQTGNISIMTDSWSSPIIYNEFRSKFTIKGEILDILYAQLKKDQFIGTTTGMIAFTKPYPNLNLVLNLQNHQSLLSSLLESKAARAQDVMMAGVTMDSLVRDDGVTLRVTSQDRNVYLGPIRVYQFPDVEREKATLQDGTGSKIATRRHNPEQKEEKPILTPMPDLDQ